MGLMVKTMAVLAVVAAAPALALEPVAAPILMDCAFGAECYETEGCQETAFHAILVGDATGESEVDLTALVELRGDAGDVTMLGTLSNGRLSLTGGAGLGMHLLTLSAEGAVRYTVHYADGPTMVSYTGICEPLP
ncbi:hypothetical protein [Sagittula sp. SSi028]|uniref:hypothetical protein n=1 Tax=Sagittula sp. SSi028 TaxID=3400636 RepID=UPI003AF96659